MIKKVEERTLNWWRSDLRREEERREEYRAIEGRGDFIGHGWRGEAMIVPKGDLIPNPKFEKG